MEAIVAHVVGMLRPGGSYGAVHFPSELIVSAESVTSTADSSSTFVAVTFHRSSSAVSDGVDVAVGALVPVT